MVEDGAAPAGRRRAGWSGRVPARRRRGEEWCDTEVLRLLRQRSLAVLRKEVEPVAAGRLARFLPAWHGIGSERGCAASTRWYG